MVKPLIEKYPDQKLEDLAKYGKCNISVWFQSKTTAEPKLISKSGTNFTDELHFVTKTKTHPYSHAKYQIDIEELRANIHNCQVNKICRMKLGEAVEKFLEIPRDQFISRWGGEYISLDSELEFREKFVRGFSVFVDHNEDFYTATQLYSSMDPAFSFIVRQEDGDQYHIDDEFVVILDKKYLKPFHCEKTEHCPYRVRYVTFSNKAYFI